jgi:transcriptional regulator with XRE-family HTH domain
MNPSAEIIRSARKDAGLTQQQLARRLGVSQAAIAQLEAANANPTIATIERALRATGHGLELRAVRSKPTVDVSLLREALRMTPAERIKAAIRLTRDAERFAAAAARSRG